MRDATLWEWAGIGFGQQEVYLLQKSLQRLAKEQSASYVRFFGKVRGVKSDYYIAETTVEGGDDEAGDDDTAPTNEIKDPDAEDRGTGVNKFTYFVTKDPFSPWTKLPNLIPRHI
jgi:radial spoke head protein 4A